MKLLVIFFILVMSCSKERSSSRSPAIQDEAPDNTETRVDQDKTTPSDDPGEQSETPAESDQASESPQQLELNGVFVEVNAIGAETSGKALQLDDDTLVELQFANDDLNAAFDAGSKVKLVGKYTEVDSIEMGTRQVFVVEQISES